MKYSMESPSPLWLFAAASASDAAAADAPGAARAGARHSAPHLPHHLAEACAQQVLSDCLGPSLRLADRAARAFVDAHTEVVRVEGPAALRALGAALAGGRYPALRALSVSDLGPAGAPPAAGAGPGHADSPGSAGAVGATSAADALADVLPQLTALTSLELRLPPAAAPAAAAGLTRLTQLRRLAFLNTCGCGGASFLAAARQLPALDALCVWGADGLLAAEPPERGPWLQLEVSRRLVAGTVLRTPGALASKPDTPHEPARLLRPLPALLVRPRAASFAPARSA